MPKKLIHPKDNTKKIHPFRLSYAQVQNTTEEMRIKIMERTGWSEATFYRKITNDVLLTEKEAKIVASVLPIHLRDIKKFQNGFSK